MWQQVMSGLSLPTPSLETCLNVIGRALAGGGDADVSEAAPSMASDAGAAETRGPASTISAAEPVPRIRPWPEPPAFRLHGELGVGKCIFLIDRYG